MPFLDFWSHKLDGKLHSVRVASVGLIKPAEFRYAELQPHAASCPRKRRALAVCRGPLERAATQAFAVFPRAESATHRSPVCPAAGDAEAPSRTHGGWSRRSIPSPPRATAGRPRASPSGCSPCCAMIFAMVVIGGITRLTESGLSITEWKPISGIIPPLSRGGMAGGVRRSTSASRNSSSSTGGMTLEEFKGIFWWEFIHRLWGRLIGVVFAGADSSGLLLRREIRRDRSPASGRHVRARRAARRARLVHGEQRPGGAHRCQPVPPGGAFPAGAGDLSATALGWR